jgi:RND family efflux transporter MFP subunit
MNKTTLGVAVGAAVLGAAIALLAPSLTSRDPTGPDGFSENFGDGWGGPQPPAVVETAPVERGTYISRAEFVGTLRANAQAELYAKTSGQIEALFADTGEPVRQGQVLARIDDDIEQQQLAQAQAALRMAEATRAQREAGLKIAETTARRLRSLFEQNLVPRQELDAAEAQLLAARAQVEVAGAQVTEARAQVDSAQVGLARTRVEAPFTGRIGKRYLDVGARAGTNDPVFSVVDLSVIKTTVSLTEKDAGRVAPGQPATVRTESFPDRRFEGRVTRMASVFDPETHTTEAEIEIDNPDVVLKPGMFATVEIEFQQMDEALLVPSTALVEDGRDTWLFVAERAPGGEASGDGPMEAGSGGAPWKARRVSVETLGGSGGEGAARVAVAPLGARLVPGERVVTLGQEDLKEGSPIRIAGAADDHPGGGGSAVAPPSQ